jgi:hypothetical protein
MATTKITSPELFDLASLDSALQLPSGTTAQRPTSPSTGEWRYNTDDNKIEFYDGADWLTIQDEDIPPVPSENFSIVTYTGNGGTQSITGVGFQPDFVWIKDYSQARNHIVFDSNRGVQKRLHTNTTDTESTLTNGLSSFDADGFSIGSNVNVNANAAGYVAWCWKVNGGTTVTNTDGSVNSTVQVNQKTGTSIIQYSASGSDLTYGHGLSQEPNFILVKARTWASAWFAWHKESGGAQYGGYFNDTSAVSAGNSQVGTPNATTIGANHPGTRNSGDYIVYAFHDVAGYSKFGTYTGSSTNQYASVFVSTGFKPAFLIIRKVTGTGVEWVMFDNKRANGGFLGEFQLHNSSSSEQYKNSGNPAYVLFTEDGFEINGNPQSVNGNGVTYIYMAFAADPTTTSPTLSDSFNIVTYNGDSNTYRDITGYEFAPTLVWAKNRNSGNWHTWKDRIRSTTPYSFLSSNLSDASNGSGANDAISEFLPDGWESSTNWNGSSAGLTNQPGLTYVGWGWKANNDSTTRDTSGTIPAIITANQAAGFSIVKYTGTGTNSQTLPHGLGAKPDFVVIKQRNAISQWVGFTDATGTFSFFYMNSSQALTAYPSMSWDATYLNLNSGGDQNGAGDQHVAYFFRSIAGFSKIGSYTGNGANQSITGLGFQPDYVMIKGATSADNWFVNDSLRGPSYTVYPNLANTETNPSADLNLTSFDSDGFSVSSSPGVNRNGDTFMYMAFKATDQPAQSIAAGEMAFLGVGGGGAAGIYYGPGGGAGGLRTSYGTVSGRNSAPESNITLAAGTYTITVGAGGGPSQTTATSPSSRSGVNTTIAGPSMTTITCNGGGGGASGGGAGTAFLTGATGGSGGGGWTTFGAGAGTANQGYQGGDGTNLGGYSEVNGGGGGAGQAGETGTSAVGAGNGGNGLLNTITARIAYYAGGGGAGGPESGAGDGTFGIGGLGGGGNGGYSTPGFENGQNAAPNTGGGGGGGSAGILAGSVGTNGLGGSGIVVLRMNTSDYSGTTTGSPTVTTDGDYTILTYTGSGTYVHS